MPACYKTSCPPAHAAPSPAVSWRRVAKDGSIFRYRENPCVPKASPYFVLLLVVALLSSLTGILISSAYGLLTGTLVQAALLLPSIAAAVLRRSFKPKLTTDVPLILIIASSILSNTLAFTDGITVDFPLIPWLKLAGIAVSLTWLRAVSNAYTHREIVATLAISATVEIVAATIILFSPQILFIDAASINPNTIGLRLAAAAVILCGCFTSNAPQLAILPAAAFACFELQARTAIAGILGAAIYGFLFSRLQHYRWPTITAISLLIFLPLTLIAAQYISDNRSQLVNSIESWRQQNAMLSELLSDRNKQKLLDDPLDRADSSRSALSQIKRRPLFGHGIGAAGLEEKFRAHNAYLFMLIQAGWFGLATWLSLYITFLATAFRKELYSSDSTERLRKVLMLAGFFVLVTSLTESSGIGSISSTSHISLILCGLSLVTKAPCTRAK